MLILPAIDLIDGKCVRLTQGDYSKETVYTDDPLTVAKRFEDQGAHWLHVVDLEGAKSGEMRNLGIIAEIARSTNLNVEVGGGVRSREAVEAVLEAGAKRAIIGSKVIQDPELAADLFNAFGESVVAGLDARDGKVAIAGWIEISSGSVEDVAVWAEKNGAKRIILTDISKDGMLQGPNMELLEKILAATTIPIIQSGGISSAADVEALTRLTDRTAEGVIIGKAIYENRIDLAEVIRNFQ